MPKSRKKLVGIAIGAIQRKYGDREALRIAKEFGADAVDFDLDGGFDIRDDKSIYSKDDCAVSEYFESLGQYARDLGLIISQTHGRGKGFAPDEAHNAAIIKNIRLDCLATAALGAPYCVIHGVSSIRMPDGTPEEMRELNYKLFSEALPFAKKYGIKLATETFGDVHGGKCCDFFGNLDEFLTAYERIASEGENRDYLAVCLDTGHSNKASRFGSNPKVPELIRALGKRIEVLHLNDNGSLFDQHLIPFVGTGSYGVTGGVDWKATLDALEEIGYGGVYNMELFLPRYGEELIVDTAAFAVKVMKNALKGR